MDGRSRKAWGFVAVAAFAMLAIARKMLDAPVIREPGLVRGIVGSGEAPRAGQTYLRQRGTSHQHMGIDIDAPKGSPVYAADAGHVAARWPDGRVSGYGNTVVIQHPDGTQTLYAHLDRFAPLAKDMHVEAGQLIGTVGQTQLPKMPMTSDPHVHFEAHVGHTLRIRSDHPERLDPMDYLADRGLSVTA